MPAYVVDQFDPPAPLAKVSLRHPTSGFVVADVPMLLDTGADVTLLPQAFVEQLGISINSANSYQLMGFDGTKSNAPSVELDVIFLSRAFKGRFLVVNQACGLIGRDVLNHVSLIFDGVHLFWKEEI